MTPLPQMVGIFTLTYVPNYFDILPMYLVVLAMMPLYMALYRVSFLADGGCVRSLSGFIAQTGVLALPAEPWSDAPMVLQPVWLAAAVLHRVRLHARLDSCASGVENVFDLGCDCVSGAVRTHRIVESVHSGFNTAAPESSRTVIREIWPLTKELRGKTEFGLSALHPLPVAGLSGLGRCR